MGNKQLQHISVIMPLAIFALGHKSPPSSLTDGAAFTVFVLNISGDEIKIQKTKLSRIRTIRSLIKR